MLHLLVRASIVPRRVGVLLGFLAVKAVTWHFSAKYPRQQPDAPNSQDGDRRIQAQTGGCHPRQIGVRMRARQGLEKQPAGKKNGPSGFRVLGAGRGARIEEKRRFRGEAKGFFWPVWNRGFGPVGSLRAKELREAPRGRRALAEPPTSG